MVRINSQLRDLQALPAGPGCVDCLIRQARTDREHLNPWSNKRRS